MQLRSDAFHDGAVIPDRYTCDGADLSPPLRWDGAPEETLSFALLCLDPDAPRGTWHHWAAYDIPAEMRELGPGAAQAAARHGFRQAINDFRKHGYGGPCPPRGGGPHHYRFHLLALDVAHLPMAGDSLCQDVEREARRHLLAEARLMGVYER
ncbi:hypothetical protein GGR34_000363 [Microvirga flocculans]|uniref:YbhB/YbcL family Raf kinase inhibitor-like protein n=1 Tax=Microvirga flocculans TaxID=217168 RepID=A0A7W6IC71_9HYPH|nr:YbhB/YbcL family Raf kinase inhibitor-like protein [Microvirga flocculans]MBB4038734.1 hypothetical protein [Microvirga flocculans]